MKLTAHCPFQSSGPFDIKICLKCKNFNLTKSTKTNHTSVSCRLNNKPPYKVHFEGLYLSNAIGINDEIEVVKD